MKMPKWLERVIHPFRMAETRRQPTLVYVGPVKPLPAHIPDPPISRSAKFGLRILKLRGAGHTWDYSGKVVLANTLVSPASSAIQHAKAYAKETGRDISWAFSGRGVIAEIKAPPGFFPKRKSRIRVSWRSPPTSR